MKPVNPFIYLFVTISLVSACTTRSRPQRPPESILKPVEEAEGPKPFLYKLTKADNTVYLLGTIHKGVDLKELPEYISDLLKSSTVSLHEAKLLDLTPDKIEPYIFLDGKKKLSNLISATGWQNLFNALSDKYKIEELDRFQPWYAASEYLSRCTKEITKGSLDLQLETTARENKIMDLELDDFDEQMQRRIGPLNIGEASRNLEKDCAHFKSELLSSINTYNKGDEKALISEYKVSEEHLETVIFARNQQWIPKILTASENHKSVFVFVGAAHLYFEQKGLLSLMEKQGFKVDRCSKKGC